MALKRQLKCEIETMLLYNTLTKQKEKFLPLKNKIAHIYTCGPTVYNYAHIGNFRSYLAADFLRRTLEYFGYKVKQVKNITDVGHLTKDDLDEGEDKIEKTARQKKLTPEAIARFYEKAFFEDEAKLNIEKAAVYPRATEHVQEMIKATEKLLKKGYAYQKDGAVFFDVSKFSAYGKLSGNTLKKLDAGHRVSCDRGKKSPFDFYLWRPADTKHLMRWPSPWGEGYPGWHIECSVMSRKYLGDTLDIHTGGEDNIFPHHENEIAQSEALTGKKFVNYWFHARYLLVNGEKMSKSKGNFYTLRDLEEKGYDPLSFRFLAFSAHYRSHLDFSLKALEQSRKNIATIKELLRRLNNIPSTKGAKQGKSQSVKTLAEKFKKDFDDALRDDLNTPLALSHLLSFISELNTLIDKSALRASDIAFLKNLIYEIDKVLGLGLKQKESIPQEIKDLAKKRQELRLEKKFEEADKVRVEIEKRGYEISDIPSQRGGKSNSFIIRPKYND